jgi:hypothetical protein
MRQRQPDEPGCVTCTGRRYQDGTPPGGRGARDYGSEGWGFESLRARPGQRPLPVAEGAFLLTPLLTAALSGVRYRAGEDVCGLGELIADHVGVDAQGDGRVGVPEPGGDDVDRDACE